MQVCVFVSCVVSVYMADASAVVPQCQCLCSTYTTHALKEAVASSAASVSVSIVKDMGDACASRAYALQERMQNHRRRMRFRSLGHACAGRAYATYALTEKKKSIGPNDCSTASVSVPT